MDKRVILNRMRRNPFFVVGSIAAVVVVVLLVFGPALLHFDPEANSLSERFLPPEGFANGLDGHILGTDDLGRDLLSRLLYGARMSIVVAIGATVLGGVIGIVLGVSLATVAGNIVGITAKASLSAVLISTGVSLAVGVIFGYLPANKAAKLNPIDALRYE